MVVASTVIISTEGVNAISGLTMEIILAARLAPPIPKRIPISPPIMVIMADSDKNCIIIDPVFAPSAFQIPISLVRSVTDTSMIFITPIPPTIKEMAATREITIVTALRTVLILLIISLKLSYW